MSIIDNQPANLNLLSGVAFRFTLNDVPNVTFFCQNAQIPGVSLGEVSIQNPLATIYKAGDMVFEPLAIRFVIDEDLQNYMEIFNWIKGLGHPGDFQEYRDFRAGTNVNPKKSTNTSRRKSDAT